MGRWILGEAATGAPPQAALVLQQPELEREGLRAQSRGCSEWRRRPQERRRQNVTYLEVTLVGSEETLKLALWAWDARPDLLPQGPAEIVRNKSVDLGRSALTCALSTHHHSDFLPEGAAACGGGISKALPEGDW